MVKSTFKEIAERMNTTEDVIRILQNSLIKQMLVEESMPSEEKIIVADE